MNSYPVHRRHHSASSSRILRPIHPVGNGYPLQISPSSGRRRPGSESDVLDAKAAEASLHHQDSLMLAYHQRPTVVAGHSAAAAGTPLRQAKPVYVWSQVEVCKWLKKHVPETQANYADLFAQHDITGKTLLMLNDSKLLRIGIREGSHRKNVLNEILKLQMKNYMQCFKGLQTYGMFDIQ